MIQAALRLFAIELIVVNLGTAPFVDPAAAAAAASLCWGKAAASFCWGKAGAVVDSAAAASNFCWGRAGLFLTQHLV